MVLTTKAGNSNYALAFSTSKTGAIGSETPDGSVIYLFAETIGGTSKSLDKRKIIPNEEVLKIFTGKTDIVLKFSNVTIKNNVKATSTEEIDEIEDFIREHGRKVGCTKVYCFVYNTSDSKYKKLSWDSSDNHLNYVYGYFGSYQWEMGRSKIYTISSITFEQVTT